MKSILSYLKNNKHLFLLLYAVIYIPWFIYLEKTVTTNFHVIHMGIDDYIPFCEFFVIPYYAWFVYMFAGIGFIAFTNGTECKKNGIVFNHRNDHFSDYFHSISERTLFTTGYFSQKQLIYRHRKTTV